MNDPPVTCQTKDGITVIQFARPLERNPLSDQTLTTLEEILRAIDRDRSIRAVVFTGMDDVFLSGADIRELRKLNSINARVFSNRGQALTQLIADLAPVTIAAINGYCMGGGLDFALACDIRIASPAAVFAHPGARLGIITGWGGTQRLPRIIGRSRAIELFATGRRMTSAEALQAVLITQIADPVLEAAQVLAAQCIAVPQ